MEDLFGDGEVWRERVDQEVKRTFSFFWKPMRCGESGRPVERMLPWRALVAF